MALVQTCEVDERECSFFTTNRIDDQTITKALYNANGKCGDIGVSATRNIVTKCNFSTDEYVIPAPTTFKAGYSSREIVVDIDVLCFDNEWYGIAVATNTPEYEEDDYPEEKGDDGFVTKKDKAAREATAAARQANHVLLYVPYLSEFKLYRRIKVHGTITCMRVLISPEEMPTQRAHLSAKIGLWPNVVAIGCKKSSCYLGQFSPFDPKKLEHFSSEDVIEVTATTDALKALVRDNRFTYLNGYFQKDDEDVTAVSYIPCYGVVVVGLSNGCIVLVPLDGKSSISCLSIPYSTPINFLIILEPEYDPQGGFFIFSARERPTGKATNAALALFSHKIARQSDGSDGYEYTDMNNVMLPLKDGAYWINVHGIVNKRLRKDGDMSANATADQSHLPDGLNTTQQMHNDGMDRTLMFYSYVTLDGQMKGGLFDLNAFYTLRCGVQQIRFDEYGQHPICSQFTMKIPNSGTQAPLFRAKDISWVHCQDAVQFESPFFDRDPVFQPMSYCLDLRIHTFGKCAYDAVVHTLQHTVIDQITRSLPTCLSQPDVALAWLERTGLVLAPVTKRERMRMEERPANERVPKDFDKIMRAACSDKLGRARVIEYIENSSFKDRKMQLNMGRLMFNVLREIVERMDDAILPLFESVPRESLSKDAKDIINYCHHFFKFAEEVFMKVRERGQKCGNDTHPLRHTRELHARMAFDLRLFFASATWIVRVLPTSEDWTHELFAELATLAVERNEKSRREGYPLFLHALLARLYGKTQDDYVWMDMADPVQWYPPRLNNLMWLVRQQEAERSDRLALLMYYLMDADEVMRRNKQRPLHERKPYVSKDYGGSTLIHSFLACVADDLMKSREGYKGVTERWESDMKGPPPKEKDDDDAERKQAGELSKDEEAELMHLIKQKWRKLQKPDEDRIRELFMKTKWGEYRYSLFKIKKGRFQEVQDLPDPGEPYESKALAEYFKYKGMALAQKAQMLPYIETHLSCCPYVITKVESKPGANSMMNDSRLVRAATINIKGKTPKKLTIFKRAPIVAAASAVDSIPTTPTSAPSDVARINALMKTPSMRFRKMSFDEDEENGGRRQNDSDVVPDEIARVRETMRTPRSRANLAARAAAAAEEAGTPEAAPRPVTVPTSILKSAHKDSRVPQSATKSKLRFAKIFDEKSISPREKNDSVSTHESMSQPNFDDSFDDGMDEAHSKSSASHNSTGGLGTTTRLEREIEEEQERNQMGTRADETDESVPPRSSGEEEGESTEERMEEDDEERRVGGADAAAGGTFTVYHDSDAALSTPGDADIAFFADSSSSTPTADATSSPFLTIPIEEEKEGEGEKEEEEAPAGGAMGETFDVHHESDAVVSASGDAACAVSTTGEEVHPFVVPSLPPTMPIEEKEEESAPSTVGGGETFVVQHDSDGGESTPGDADKAFFVDSAASTPAADAAKTGDVLTAVVTTPPPTIPIEEKEEEVVETPSVDGEEKEGEDNAAAPIEEEKEEGEAEGEPSFVIGQLSPMAPGSPQGRIPTPAITVYSDPIDGTYRPFNPQLSETFRMYDSEDERPAEVSMDGDAVRWAQQAAEVAAEGVALAASAAGGEEAAGEGGGETGNTPLSHTLTIQVAVDVSGGEEGEGEETAPVDPAADETEEKEEEQPNLSRPATPLEGERREEDAAAAGVVQPPPTKTPPPTPAEEEEEEEEVVEPEEAEEAVEPAAVAAPIEKEEEEETPFVQPAPKTASFASAAARRKTPPRPKPRTVFPSRAEPIALGLRSYSYMEDGIEKSYEEQEGSSDEEKGKEEEEDILARLPPRRSSSRLQSRGEESAVLPPPVPASRKRTTSRSRKESEQQDVAGPSTSTALLSPREKRKKKEEEEMKKEGEEHVYTTTRTRVVEERYVEREDGVLRHTVKQSTKVIETADGVVVSTEQEERDTISEEGDREERGDEADRATPLMVEAAEEPTTARRSSRARSGVTPSRTSTRTKKEEKKEEEETKKREEKESTPLRSLSHSVTRKKLMSDDQEEEKQPEPLTPRRSSRARKPSESSSTVSQTPSKSSKKSTKTAQSPSREQSAVPSSSRRLVLVPEEEEKGKSPARRGRPPKESIPSPDEPLPVRRRTTMGSKTASASTRNRSASESVGKKEEGEKEEEEEGFVDHIANLRKRVEASRAMKARKEEEAKKKAGRPKKLVTIPEDKVVKADKKSKEDEDQPSTSQQASRSTALRKRSASETAKEKMEPTMKTPSKKKAKAIEKDDDDEEGAGDQSILRRSTRKAAVTANEGLKTPSKSTKGKH